MTVDSLKARFAGVGDQGKAPDGVLRDTGQICDGRDELNLVLARRVTPSAEQVKCVVVVVLGAHAGVLAHEASSHSPRTAIRRTTPRDRARRSLDPASSRGQR